MENTEILEKEGKEKSTKRNLWLCLLIIAGYALIYKSLGWATRKLPFENEFTAMLLNYCVMAPILVVVAYKLKKKNIFHFTLKSFFKGLLVGLFYLILAMFFASITIWREHFLGTQPLPWIDIAIFVLCILLGTGFTEEVLFRGIVFNLLEDQFGKNSRKNIMKSILLTSMFFGMIHLLNLISDEKMYVPYVVLQCINAFFTGMCLNAIYFRSGNIWSTIAIHGFWDFGLSIQSGVYGIGKIMSSMTTENFDAIADEAAKQKAMNSEMIASSVVIVVLGIIQLLLCWFFMRKKKVLPLLEEN